MNLCIVIGELDGRYTLSPGDLRRMVGEPGEPKLYDTRSELIAAVNERITNAIKLADAEGVVVAIKKEIEAR